MDKKIIPALLAAAVLTACVSAPAPRQAAAPAQPVNLTKVYFYPTQGQSDAQQDRDRYDCHVWAVKESDFDPSRHIAPKAVRATVVPARAPGETIGAAAVVGAMIGAVAAGPGDIAKGAVVGAMAGTVVGSAAAASDEANADAANAAAARRYDRGAGKYEQEAAGYRRAMSACLTGRGYSVR